jgi:hypothetical protein
MKKIAIISVCIMLCIVCSAQINITKRTVTTDSLRSRQDTLWLSDKKGHLTIIIIKNKITQIIIDTFKINGIAKTDIVMGNNTISLKSGNQKTQTILSDYGQNYLQASKDYFGSTKYASFKLSADSGVLSGFIRPSIISYVNGLNNANTLFTFLDTMGLGINKTPTEKLDVDGNIKGTSVIVDATQDTTVTAIKGRMVYKASDNHFYGCVGTTGKKWKQLDN